ncbi:DUF4998 domain-containing protein [Niabella drilacis]|uniref:DUF4998 domain-containing protein n=1 Tax=Niabella drilacis (strain DSM 25811 / CCM 8410 / CCUG 62505 / LMG 26954 / E90) TaxID=1285928 RepID=A0A1G6Y0P9_NIADE|nr:DUF4998 domain-containing protein [Niabella drilacis]SDD83852.1 protein of unknown function [Niabella drilacis]
MTKYPFLVYAGLLLLLWSCSKMNDLHKKYLENGEIIYLNKLSALSSMPGKNRVRLQYVNKDPKVKKVILYWNTRADSVVLDMPENRLGDTLYHDLTGLSEDSYVFETVTSDAALIYRSMAGETAARAYGEQFQNSLQQQAISLKEWSQSKNSLSLKFYLAPRYALFSEFRFTDVSGATKSVRVPYTVSDSVFQGVGGEITYRTAFLPEAGCIDTFYTNFTQLNPVIKP